MGLCRCRTVTNLFCFEHRKNVCEKCIMSDHARCIVRSYLQWLQDSDFESVCGICRGGLDTGETIRLTCYDLFHVDCLNKHCGAMPENTAPAGYTCPTCHTLVIPAENMVSPIAAAIRERLKSASWASEALMLASTHAKAISNGAGSAANQSSVHENGHMSGVGSALDQMIGSTNAVVVSVTDGAAPYVIDTGMNTRKMPKPNDAVASRPAMDADVDDTDDDKYGQRVRRDRTPEIDFGAIFQKIKSQISMPMLLIGLIVFMIFFMMFTAFVLRPAPEELEPVNE